MKLVSDDLINAISICNKVVDTEEINLECSSKGITFSKASNFNKVSYFVKCKAEECSFSINVNLFLGILRGTSDIELKYIPNDHSIKFSSGRKSGILSTFTYKPIKVLASKTNKDFNFGDDVKDIILKLLNKVNISPTPFLPESESSLEIQVKSNGKELSLFCVDRFHSAYCETLLKSEKFEVNIPISYISYLNLFDTSFNMSKDENCIYLYNDILKICLPQVVNYSPITIDRYKEGNTIFGKPLLELESFDISSFNDAVMSTDVVKTNLTDVYMTINKGEVKLQCESEVGKVYANIDSKGKIKGSYSIIIQQSNVMDVLNLIDGKSCTFRLFDNFMMFESVTKTTKSVFICSVGQKTGK